MAVRAPEFQQAKSGINPLASEAYLIGHVAELIGDLRHYAGPADRSMDVYFRAHRSLGARDRRFVGNVFYHALRHLRRIDQAILESAKDTGAFDDLPVSCGFPAGECPWAQAADSENTSSDLDRRLNSLRAALAYIDMENPPLGMPLLADNRLLPSMNPERALSALARLADPMRTPQAAVRHSFPEWIWELLCAEIPAEDERDAMAMALNRPAEACLRANTLRSNPEELAARLASARIDVRRGTLVPECFVSSSRIGRGAIGPVREGLAVFQDEGSQFITERLGARPGMTVIDACAGAGGKALHLAALMQNRGRIWVHEPSAGRLRILRERAKAAGAAILEEISPSRALPIADLVLLDVPCSGFGTLRRSPELKWRTSPEILEQLVRLQFSILNQWCESAGPGGRIAYVTCSLLREENTAQIESFLASHSDFARVPFHPHGRLRPDMITPQGDLQLWPHRHGCDGFFLAVLKKKR